MNPVNLAISRFVISTSTLFIRSFRFTLPYVLLAFTAVVSAREVPVYDRASLHDALRNAAPGDEIVLYPGYYQGLRTESPEDRWHYFYSHKSGTASSPIIVRSYSRSDMQTLFGSDVNSAGYVFYLTGDHWQIKDIKFHTGQKGIMLDSANHNIFDNIAIHNVRDEGMHFRNSSSNNVLSNCLIYNTGRQKPGFGEAVYVGSHEGNLLGDYSNNNRIGGCQLGPGVTAESVDIKAGTINTIVEYNTLNGKDISGVNFSDSFIDIKGDRTIIRFNRMHWEGNNFFDHGIHILRRDHISSNIYNNVVTLDNELAFLKIGQGTVHARGNELNYTGPFANNYGNGSYDSSIDNNLPPVQKYPGFVDGDDPPPEESTCLKLDKDKKVEIDTSNYDCVDIPVELSGRLLQVWDSNTNTSCNFRGDIVSASSGTPWSINANYAGTRSMNGNRINIVPANGCNFLIMRWL